jgi:hypothetical protein
MTPDGAVGGTSEVVPGSGAGVPGRRHKIPALRVGEPQLRQILAAMKKRSAYNEPVAGIKTRAAALTPAGAVVPVWWRPVELGVEDRLAAAILTRPAPETGNEFDYPSYDARSHDGHRRRRRSQTGRRSGVVPPPRCVDQVGVAHRLFLGVGVRLRGCRRHCEQ